jgi:cell fate (sporulation/competence/biofilm development) regulator YlbF (YheA/YmcA/DUF963 family)
MFVNSDTGPEPSPDLLAQLTDQMQRLDRAIAQLDEHNPAQTAEAVEAAREALKVLQTYLQSKP